MNAPEISIFLDTNCLEARDKKNILHLFKLKVPAEFYILCRFITELDLSEKVEICISEITWMEIKEHLFNCYKDTHDTLKTDISTHKSRLGSLLNIDYSIAHTSASEYREHIETITTEFIENNICKIIPYPRTVELLDVLVGKAVRTQAPFCRVRHNGKDYSDAGFKDALIAETIISYCNKNKTLGVFITKDNDFGKNAEQSIEILDAIDKAKEYLSNKYSLTDENQIKRSFETDKYLQEKIILETGNPYDDSVLNFIVNKVGKIDDDSDLFNITSQCQINETQYTISFTYDKGANEILGVEYELQNE